VIKTFAIGARLVVSTHRAITFASAGISCLRHRNTRYCFQTCTTNYVFLFYKLKAPRFVVLNYLFTDNKQTGLGYNQLLEQNRQLPGIAQNWLKARVKYLTGLFVKESVTEPQHYAVGRRF